MPQDGAERLRGHGALLGAMDTTVHVERLSDDMRTATVIKANDSEEGERVAFTLESVTIGPETTAPVVVEQDADKARKPSKGAALRPRAKLALDAFTETILAHAQPAPIGLGIAADVKTVTLDQWREELFTKNVIDRQAANPRADFSRVLQQLAGRQIIGTHNNLVWRVQSGVAV